MKTEQENFISHTPSPTRILIVGAGIAGLCLARQLRTMNISFLMIEKRPNFSIEGVGIALPANAVQALRYIGLGDKIDQYAHSVNKIICTTSTGDLLSEASLLEPPLNVDRFVALNRHQLHQILQEDMADVIQFSTYIDRLFNTEDGVLVKFNHPNLQPEKFKAVIGADGI